MSATGDLGYRPPPTPPRGRRPASRRGTIAAFVVAAVLVVAACVVGGAQLHSQHRDLATARSDLAKLDAAMRSQSASAAASLKASQSQIAALEAQLTGTQNQLKADEKQLKVTSAALPPDVVKLASQVSSSVVLIGCGTDLGSGFALSLPVTPGFQSVVITAEHVVDACTTTGAAAMNTTPAALTMSHGGVSLHAKIRSSDPGIDLAILDVTTALPALAPGPAPDTGAFTMAVGNPLGLTNNVTTGNVSQVDPGFFLNTAPISNGNSGGPLVDRDGKVLGVADSAAAANDEQPVVENLNYAVRLSALCPALLSGSVCTQLH